MGAGLAVLSGLRAFIPVGFLALYSRLEFRRRSYLGRHRVRVPTEDMGDHPLARSRGGRAPARQGCCSFHARATRSCSPSRLSWGAWYSRQPWPRRLDSHDVSGVLGAGHRRTGRPRPAFDAARRRTQGKRGDDPIILISIYEDLLVLIAHVAVRARALDRRAGGPVFLGLLFYRLPAASGRRKHKGLRILKGLVTPPAFLMA